MPNSESAAQLALRLLPVPLSGTNFTAGADRPAPARLPNSTVPGTWSQGPALAGGLPLRLTHPASLRSGQLAWAGTLGGRAVPLKLAAGCAIQAASERQSRSIARPLTNTAQSPGWPGPAGRRVAGRRGLPVASLLPGQFGQTRRWKFTGDHWHAPTRPGSRCHWHVTLSYFDSLLSGWLLTGGTGEPSLTRRLGGFRA
jgi:hypothetical protein